MLAKVTESYESYSCITNFIIYIYILYTIILTICCKMFDIFLIQLLKKKKLLNI